MLPHAAGACANPSSYSLENRFAAGELTTKLGIDAAMPLAERADTIGAAYAGIDLAADQDLARPGTA